MPKLTRSDIDDTSVFEQNRRERLNEVIALKKVRRVTVGDRITLVFENSATIRFQIQEAVRVERLTDLDIERELDVCNELVPDPGHLAATLFVEVTSDDEWREWLPKLVGIEQAVELRLGPAGAVEVVPCLPAAGSTGGGGGGRDDATSSVHYVHFRLTDPQIEAFTAGPVRVAVAHPNYSAEVELRSSTVDALVLDLRHGG